MKGVRFWRALLRSFLHSLATLAAVLSVWALWLAWFVFADGRGSPQWGRLWGVYRFGMRIALVVALILGGGFLLMSLLHHWRVGRISKQRRVPSSLTLALSSLALWPALPEGGTPLIALLIGLPVVAALWMLESGGRARAA